MICNGKLNREVYADKMYYKIIDKHITIYKYIY